MFPTRRARSTAQDPKGKVSLVTDTKRSPALKAPAGLVMDGFSHTLVIDGTSGDLVRLRLADGSTSKLADGFGSGSLVWDKHGRLYGSDGAGRVFVIPRPGEKPVLLASGFQSASGLGLDPTGKSILVADTKAGTVTAMPAAVPGQEVDQRPLPLKTAVAFPNLQWTGWKSVTDSGKIVPLRPIVLTHAGDGSNRVFVATQHGVIHVFPNDPKATKTKRLPRHPGTRPLQRRRKRAGFPRPGLPPELQEERRILRLLHAEETPS